MVYCLSPRSGSVCMYGLYGLYTEDAGMVPFDLARDVVVANWAGRPERIRSS